MSPAEVITLLHDAHMERDYTTLAVLISKPNRDDMIALLRSIDAVLDGNARVQRAAALQYEGPYNSPWSLAFIENNLGVFSRDMKVLNQSFSGDEATVNVQEGDNVPIVRAKLVRADGRWQYVPEIPPKAMNRELDRLAALLKDIEGSVSRGLEMDSFVDAFFVRVLPQMERVATAKDVMKSYDMGDDVMATAGEGE